MACSKCKKQKQREEVLAEVAKVERPIKVFLVIVLGLGVFGLISLFRYVFKLFG